MLPFNVRRHSMKKRKAYMQRLIAFVSMQWHANKWHKTLLGSEQGFELGIKLVLRYYLPYSFVPKRWRPGEMITVLSILGAPRSRRSRYSLREPNRGLAGILYFRVRDLMNSNNHRVRDLMNSNSLELMLSFAYLFGVIAFWEMAPPILLEVDPTLVLQPEKVQILRKVILHHGCQPLDVGGICTCTENPVHNHIAEDFQLQRSLLGGTEEARAKARVNALAIALSAAVMGILLNAVTTSTGC